MCETLHIGINLSPQSFTMIEENSENGVFETLQIGINSPIQSLTMVEEKFEK